jgi:pyruvate dehydrogenase E1 component
MNENYAQQDLPDNAAKDVIRGCYKLKTVKALNGNTQSFVSLLGSGAIMTEVLKAADMLANSGVNVDIFSVTSWSELSRDGKAKEQAILSGKAEAEQSFISQVLSQGRGPIVAATDYVHLLPESIRAYVPEGRRYITLGTDGFGRSDTRAALREYFGVNADSISKTAIESLRK